MTVRSLKMSMLNVVCPKIAANVEALAKKGNLENECSAFAQKFHSSTKVEFTTSSPFFANAMLVDGLGFKERFFKLKKYKKYV
jgi:hypothetical protein